MSNIIRFPFERCRPPALRFHPMKIDVDPAGLGGVGREGFVEYARNYNLDATGCAIPVSPLQEQLRASLDVCREHMRGEHKGGTHMNCALCRMPR